jgi:hypothetical protein
VRLQGGITFASGPGSACSLPFWIADLLPDEVAGDIRALIEQGSAVIKKTLERR